MSYDHTWIGLLLNQDQVDRIRPAFDEASGGAAPAPVPAVDLWRTHPDRFEDTSPTLDGAAANAFIWSFNLPAFVALATHFTWKDGTFTDLLDEETVFRYSSIRRSSPVSVLWHALGYERSCRLPGILGNLLLGPEDVPDALHLVLEVYKETSPEALTTRGLRYCGGSNGVEEVREVISFLPEGLERARELGKGFFSIAFGQP